MQIRWWFLSAHRLPVRPPHQLQNRSIEKGQVGGVVIEEISDQFVERPMQRDMARRVFL